MSWWWSYLVHLSLNVLHDEIDCDLVLSPSWHDEVGVSHPRGDVVVKGRLDVTVVLLQHVRQVTTALGSGQAKSLA